MIFTSFSIKLHVSDKMRRRFALVQLPTRLLQSQKRKFTGLVAVQQVEESNIKETQKFPSFQCASQKCHNCGKPVKPVQTVNCKSFINDCIWFLLLLFLANSRFLHCSECNSLFATASGADNLNKWNALKSSSTMSRRPPYPSEVSLFHVFMKIWYMKTEKRVNEHDFLH